MRRSAALLALLGFSALRAEAARATEKAPAAPQMVALPEPVACKFSVESSWAPLPVELAPGAASLGGSGK